MKIMFESNPLKSTMLVGRLALRCPAEVPSGGSGVHKGGFSKGGGGVESYAFPLCNCNTLGSVFNVEIVNRPNC